ncbi:hypothetical protein MRY82_07590 [bacterium]|nr:hypothetical protein [bacterium]
MLDKTYITVFDFKIFEPVTALTDIVVAIVCFWACYQLHKLSLKKSSHQSFKVYFLLMAFATLYAGIFGHALFPYLSMNWKIPGWILAMLSLTFLERASILQTRGFVNHRFLLLLTYLNIIEFIVFFVLVLWTQEFKFIEIHSGYAFLCVVLPLNIYFYLRTKHDACKYFFYGIGFSGLAVLTFNLVIGFHAWFNHIDLSHCLLAIAAYFFYLGAKRVNKEA